MTATVTVHDETASGEKIHTLKVQLPQAHVSVRELIQHRIQQEARKFNLERPVCFHALVQPLEAQETSRGFRLPVHRDVDWEQQSAAALNAFVKKNISVLVNGREMQDLDGELDLNEATVVSFVKLMPIVAG